MPWEFIKKYHLSSILTVFSKSLAVFFYNILSTLTWSESSMIHVVSFCFVVGGGGGGGGWPGELRPSILVYFRFRR